MTGHLYVVQISYPSLEKSRAKLDLSPYCCMMYGGLNWWELESRKIVLNPCCFSVLLGCHVRKRNICFVFLLQVLWKPATKAMRTLSRSDPDFEGYPVVVCTREKSSNPCFSCMQKQCGSLHFLDQAFNIGNEKQVSFWLDHWIELARLEDLYPELFSLTLKPNIWSVAGAINIRIIVLNQLFKRQMSFGRRSF